jgi:uncharacterized protein (DUF1778 family)
MSLHTTTESAPPTRVKVQLKVTDQDRHWFKAAAAHECMGLEEWLYSLAVRRAQEMDVPRPFARIS